MGDNHAASHRGPEPPPQPVAVEATVTMSDGSHVTYTFPEGVNPEVTLHTSNDPTAGNQRVALTIFVEQSRSTRTDGVLYTMTVPAGATPA